MKDWIPAKKELLLWITVLMGFSLVYSRFMISVCMFAWLVMAFLSWSYEYNRPILSRGVSRLGRLLIHPSNRAHLLMTGFFFIPLLFGVHSADQSEFLERLRIKLPFLGISIAFVLLPPLGRKAWRILLVSFNIALISSACYVLFQYALHFEVFNEQLAQGIPMPTPVNHTRYSLMIALVILFNTAALFKHRLSISRWLMWIGAISTLLLFLFLHILSVRSGLAVLYIGMTWLAISYAWYKQSLILGLGLTTLIILIPILAYQTSPSLKKRVDYMQYDIKQYLKGEGQDYSDADRIFSLRAGWAVFKNHPWIGVGTGDVRHAVEEYYQRHELTVNKLPHNQFITVLAANGMVGLLLFLYCLFKPIFDQRRYKSIYFSSFFIVLFLSFMVENTIENSVGVAFHTSLMFMLLHRERSLSNDALPDEIV